MSVKTFTNKDYVDQLQLVQQSSGFGGFVNRIQTFMYGIDRFGMRSFAQNKVKAGYTFITCPRLNLAGSNITMDRVLSVLNSDDSNTLSFAIRCLLDTQYRKDNITNSANSPLVNPHNPFLTPVMNGLKAMTGWPDYGVETFTTEGGYHSENQTFAIGSDELNGTYDFNLEFSDGIGGPIMAIHLFWLKYMSLATKGKVINYKDDVDQQRMPYTVSIYRFIVDPSYNRIVSYAKATGCFPKNIPIGATMNINSNELFVSSALEFSVPYTVNHVAYNDYGIIMDFNRLMNRYCSGISKMPVLSNAATNNFLGLPYIHTTDYEMRLVFHNDL